MELALAAPMLVLLMTAGYDFGSAFYEQQRVTAAARAGVQYAIQSQAKWTDTTDITAAVRADAGDTANILTVSSGTCTCPSGTSQCNTTSACTGSTVSGTYVQVTVSESFSTLVQYPFITSPFTISNEVMVRVE